MYKDLVVCIRDGKFVLGLGRMYIGWAPFHVSGSAGLNLSGVGCMYEDWVACIRVGLPLLGDGCIYQEWVACIRIGLHVSGLGCLY